RSTSPVSGRWIPARILPSVDLPAPFSPIKPWHSPRAMVNVTPSSAVTPPNVFVMPAKLITLFLQPLVPILAVGFDVFLGDFCQRVNDAFGRRILALDDFVEEKLDGLVAPAVAVLRVECGNVPALDVTELRWQRVAADDL